MRLLGQQPLVDAYALVLGKHRALSAIASNEAVRCTAPVHLVLLLRRSLVGQLLMKSTVTPGSIAGVFEALCSVVGLEDGRSICSREPSVLHQSAACVSICLAALESTLKSRSLVREVVSSNPTLLQPGRDEHIICSVKAVSDVFSGDVDAAMELVQRNTLLLGTPASTISGAYAALSELFGGKDVARGMVIKNPGLLRSLPRTLKGASPLRAARGRRACAIPLTRRSTGAWRAIVALQGSEEKAAEIVGRNSSVLRSRPVTISSAASTLAEIFGKEAAARLIAGQLGLLRSRSVTLRESFDFMAAVLGPDKAVRLLAKTPALLQVRAVVLRYNWAHLSTYLGGARAAALVEAVPHVVALRVGRAARLTDSLTRIFGDPETVAEIVPPQLYRSSGEALLSRFEDAAATLGADEARRRFSAEPRLLISAARNLPDKLLLS